MADNHIIATQTRPDEDIRQDVLEVFNTYPPLKHDRSRIDLHIEGGVVTATGYVRTPQNRDRLVAGIQAVPGVVGTHADDLHDDLTLQRTVGQLTPYRVYVQASYGAIVLTGELVEDDANEEKLLAQVRAVPGVRTVISKLKK